MSRFLRGLETLLGYIVLIVGYGAVWVLDRLAGLAGQLDREQEGEHWDVRH